MFLERKSSFDPSQRNPLTKKNFSADLHIFLSMFSIVCFPPPISSVSVLSAHFCRCAVRVSSLTDLLRLCPPASVSYSLPVADSLFPMSSSWPSVYVERWISLFPDFCPPKLDIKKDWQQNSRRLLKVW